MDGPVSLNTCEALKDIQDWLASLGLVAKYVQRIFKAFFMGSGDTCNTNFEYAALTLLALYNLSCDIPCDLHHNCQY